MARHRNIRNLKRSDFDEDDFDIYGQSYEDDYGVSPSTAESYMYSRSSGKNFQLSSYIPSENTVEEDREYFDTDFKHSKEVKFASNSSNKNKLKNNASNHKTVCVATIQNAVGEHYSMADIQKVAMQFDYNAEKAINFLLISGNLSVNFGTTKSKKTYNDKPLKKTVNSALPQTDDRGRRAKLTEVCLKYCINFLNLAVRKYKNHVTR